MVVALGLSVVRARRVCWQQWSNLKSCGLHRGFGTCVRCLWHRFCNQIGEVVAAARAAAARVAAAAGGRRVHGAGCGRGLQQQRG